MQLTKPAYRAWLLMGMEKVNRIRLADHDFKINGSKNRPVTPSAAAARMAELKADLNESRFAWSGPIEFGRQLTNQ